MIYVLATIGGFVVSLLALYVTVSVVQAIWEGFWVTAMHFVGRVKPEATRYQRVVVVPVSFVLTWWREVYRVLFVNQYVSVKIGNREFIRPWTVKWSWDTGNDWRCDRD